MNKKTSKSLARSSAGSAKSKKGFPRSDAALNSQIRRVKLSSFDGGWLIASATGGESGHYIRLQDLNGYTTYAGSYDQYRITRVRAMCIPRNNVQSLTTTAVTATNQLPPYFMAVDYDDANAPSSYTDLLEYTNVQCFPSWETGIVSWKPSAAIAAYNGAFSGYAVSEPGQWYDCASAGIQFYGLKAATYTDNGGQTTHQQYDLFITATVEFRMTH
jgi:hypothetical protein